MNIMVNRLHRVRWRFKWLINQTNRKTSKVEKTALKQKTVLVFTWEKPDKLLVAR